MKIVKVTKKDKADQSLARINALLGIVVEAAKGLDTLPSLFIKEKVKGTSDAETIRTVLSKINGAMDAINSKVDKLNKML